MKQRLRAGKLHLFIAYFAFIMLMGVFSSCYAQNFEFTGRRSKHRISFQMIKNLVIVPVYLNNIGPFNFILDTGVSPMIITDSTIVGTLSLKNLRATKISGLGKGPDIDALLTNEISARVGKASILNIPTAILKEDLLGLSNYVGIKIHGLIGYYFFNSFIVSINYPNKSILFQLHTRNPKIDGEQIPIQLVQNKPYINAKVVLSVTDSLIAKVLVDNGAGHAISLESYFNKPFPVPEKSVEANLGNGLSGPISGKIARIAALQIGSFRLGQVISSFPVYDDAAAKTLLLNRNGNLGADLLSKFNITLDYQNRYIYFKKNSNYKNPFEHDMSGMEIYTDDNNKKRFFVLRIEPGSVAEESGVKVNDELLSINFISTKQMDLNQITNILRSGDGKSLFVAFNRDGKVIFKLMKLKRRI